MLDSAISSNTRHRDTCARTFRNLLEGVVVDGVHHEAHGFALPPRTIVVGEDVGIRRLPENRLKGENLGDKTNGVVIIEVVSHVQRSTVAVVDFRTDRRFYPDDTLLVRTAGAGATSRPGVGREQLLVEERKPLDDGQVRGCRDEIRGVGAGGQLYGSAFRDRREFFVPAFAITHIDIAHESLEAFI